MGSWIAGCSSGRTAAAPVSTAPAAKNAGACLHTDLALIEVADADLLQEFRADRTVGPLIITLLSDRVAIVATGGGEDLVKRLRKAGHTPKVVTWGSPRGKEP
jgi:hypothetical protein